MHLTQEQFRSINHRDSVSFEFHLEISRPFGDLDKILLWCKTELQGDWRWQLLELSTIDRPGNYKFYFDSERDCVAFSLKWC